MSDPSPPIDPERAAMIAALRERYLNGTIDEVLIPEDVNLTPLMEDLALPEANVPLRRINGGRSTRSEEIA